jgi:hypothetical protein
MFLIFSHLVLKTVHILCICNMLQFSEVLVKDVRIHWPLICDHCGKWFSESGSLITHGRILTCEKPLYCHKFQRAFTSWKLGFRERAYTTVLDFEHGVCVCGVWRNLCAGWTRNYGCGYILRKNHEDVRFIGEAHTTAKSLSDVENAFQKVKVFYAWMHSYWWNPIHMYYLSVFTAKGHRLGLHKPVHIGERPFECDICGKSCTVWK